MEEIELRNNQHQLYSRGDRSKHGNLNLRSVEQDGELHLRANVSNGEWIHVPACLPREKGRYLAGDKPYGVGIIRYDGKYELRVSFEEERELKVGFEKGAVGVDFNHDSIDLAVANVANDQGQLKDEKTINCTAPTAARGEERGWMIGNLAKKVVDYAKYRHRGLVIERLEGVVRERSNQHKFTHKKFLEAVERRAECEGVEIREVPRSKSCLYLRHRKTQVLIIFNITIHQAAELVVARRGQGFSEHLRGLKTPLLEALEGGGDGESAPDRRVHSWSPWSLTRNLPSRKGTDYKHPGQSPETTEVESSGTSSPTEGRPGEGDSPGGRPSLPVAVRPPMRWQREQPISRNIRLRVPGVWQGKRGRIR